MNIKERLKQNHIFYFLLHSYRNWRQNRLIEREQRDVESRARGMGIVQDEDPRTVMDGLIDNLLHRGIIWPPDTARQPLHILYASVPGNWEPHNIPPELETLGRVSYFFLKDYDLPFDQGWAAVRQQVDAILPDVVRKIHAVAPITMMLSYLSGAQVSASTIEQIKGMGIPTFAFHLDDRRFFYGYEYGDQWSGPAAVCSAYDLNLTNAPASLVKYRCEGGKVLFWPEGANPEFFRPIDLPCEYDVSFCGQRYGQRPLLINYLRKQGIRVACFGSGWEHGYQSDEALVKIFNSSAINLGFGFVTESDDQCLKGRDFEIPACGAVYLSSHNDDLPRVYQIGIEIETYTDFADCARKIRMLLADPERRARMRAAARAAILARHTWALRVQQLLEGEAAPTVPAVPAPDGMDSGGQLFGQQQIVSVTTS